jgi:hypothetical protein
VSHVHSLAIHRHGVSIRPHLLGNRHSLNAGYGVRGKRKRENHSNERAKTRQQAKPQRESENPFTLAPRVQADYLTASNVHSKKEAVILSEPGPERISVRGW